MFMLMLMLMLIISHIFENPRFWMNKRGKANKM